MSRAFIAFYMGDYARDTGHLSTIEHGAYFLLLQHCWVHGTIPCKPDSRAKLAKVSLRQWYKIRTNIDPFFDDQGRNKRATKEIEKAEKTSIRQTMSGHKGANKRWGKDGHGYTMANSHGHAPSDGHGMAIKKEDITTTTSVTAPARDPVDNSGSNDDALPAGFAEKARQAVQQSPGKSYLVEALTRRGRRASRC
jgi:uncharacterized protein YdaU (DUF1376 family)